MADERNVAFVVESRKSGKTDDEIFDEFEKAGYAPEEIKEIFDEANVHVSPTAQPSEAEERLQATLPEKTAEKRFHLSTLMKVAIVLVVGIIIAGGLIYGLVLMNV